MSEGPEQYAGTAWTIEDVQAVFDVSDAEARAFLAKYESDIRDGMNQRGWETIEHYGNAEGWKAVDD